MDDDAPLSALARPQKFDDDTPLASLADVGGKPRASPKAGGKTAGSLANKIVGSPKVVAGKAKAKMTPKRKKQDSSSSSSSSDNDSSSSDSGAKAAPVKRQKSKLLRKQQTDEGMGEDGAGAVDGGGAVKKKDRSIKEQVVADLLCRWWYVLPDWPPNDDAFYQAELAKRSLKKVSIDQWEWEPDIDSKGRKKVYELTQFRGLFRNSAGDLIDIRPRDTCPCYTNFMKKDVTELYDLLIVAFENQIKDLQNSKYAENQLLAELNTQLTSIRNKAYQAKQSGVRRKSG